MSSSSLAVMSASSPPGRVLRPRRSFFLRFFRVHRPSPLPSPHQHPPPFQSTKKGRDPKRIPASPESDKSAAAGPSWRRSAVVAHHHGAHHSVREPFREALGHIGLLLSLGLPHGNAQTQKKSLPRNRGRDHTGNTASTIFQEILQELAPFRFREGCRGFVGPVPPPLWMRRSLFSCCGHYREPPGFCQRHGKPFVTGPGERHP